MNVQTVAYVPDEHLLRPASPAGPVRIEQRRAAIEDPAILAVMPPQPVFHSEFATVVEGLVVNLETRPNVLRVYVFSPSVLRALYQECRRPASFTEPDLVEEVAYPFLVRDPNHRWGVRDHQPETGLAFSQTRLNPHAFGQSLLALLRDAFAFDHLGPDVLVGAHQLRLLFADALLKVGVSFAERRFGQRAIGVDVAQPYGAAPDQSQKERNARRRDQQRRGRRLEIAGLDAEERGRADDHRNHDRRRRHTPRDITAWACAIQQRDQATSGARANDPGRERDENHRHHRRHFGPALDGDEILERRGLIGLAERDQQ